MKQPDRMVTTEPNMEEVNAPPSKCDHMINIPVYEGTWVRYWQCRCGQHKAWEDAMT